MGKRKQFKKSIAYLFVFVVLLTSVSFYKPEVAKAFVVEWDKLVNEIHTADSGSNIIVQMGTDTTIPKTVFSAIYGRDITLRFEFPNYSWTVNGMNVADNTMDINFFARTYSYNLNPTIEEKYKGIKNFTNKFILEIAHNGDFQCKPVLNLKLGQKVANYANLFYVNESTKELEFKQSSKIKNNCTVDFNFTHASKYVVILDNTKMSSEKDIKKIETNDKEDTSEPDTRKDFHLANKKTDSANYTVTLSKSKYSYTGKSYKPEVTVKRNATKLKSGVDYKVSYSNNKNIGTAKITVKGTGKYTGTATKTFKIEIKKGSIYTVQSIKYKVTNVSTNGTVLIVGTTYKKDNNKFVAFDTKSTITIGGKRFKVTEIGKNAFKDYTNLKSIVIGENVKKIDSGAFYNCNHLNKIEIESKQLKTIGSEAFVNIAHSTKVKMPASKKNEYLKLLNNALKRT